MSIRYEILGKQKTQITFKPQDQNIFLNQVKICVMERNMNLTCNPPPSHSVAKPKILLNEYLSIKMFYMSLFKLNYSHRLYQPVNVILKQFKSVCIKHSILPTVPPPHMALLKN